MGRGARGEDECEAGIHGAYNGYIDYLGYHDIGPYCAGKELGDQGIQGNNRD